MDRNGYITCEEAFRWSEEGFRGHAIDPKHIVHPYGTSNATQACMHLADMSMDNENQPVALGGKYWTKKLRKNVVPIIEARLDGRVFPNEFDDGLAALPTYERNQLISDILQHPLIHRII